MPLVYAAGDITGGVKQIVTAVSQGAVAALTALKIYQIRIGRGKKLLK